MVACVIFRFVHHLSVKK